MVLTGRFVLLTVLGAVPLVLWPSWATAGWVLLALAVAGAADAALAPSPRRLEVQRTATTPVRLETPSQSVLSVRNPDRRTVRAVFRDAWPPSAGAGANRHRWKGGAGERAEFVTPLLPTRRGDRHAAPVTVRTRTALGLVARQVNVEVPATVRVMPPFRSSRHLPSKLARLRELDGATTVMVRGQGSEFDSLRDYVVGDDVRSIDWRASARRQHVVVRTWRPERDRRVIIVLDSSRQAAARVGDETRFDAAIEAALLLTALASQSGDRVDVLIADRRVRASVQQRPGTRILSSLSDQLAGIEPDFIEADWPLIVSAVDDVSRQRSLVVLLTDLNAAALSETLVPVLPMLTRRHSVVLASVSDPALAEYAARRDTAADAFLAASAERARLDRAGVARMLRAAGLETLDETPESLAPALADLYIALKATGRL